MFDIIKDWAPIIISGLSLIFSVITGYKNSKNEKKLEVYRQKQNDFEDYKEKVRQQEKPIRFNYPKNRAKIYPSTIFPVVFK